MGVWAGDAAHPRIKRNIDAEIHDKIMKGLKDRDTYNFTTDEEANKKFADTLKAYNDLMEKVLKKWDGAAAQNSGAEARADDGTAYAGLAKAVAGIADREDGDPDKDYGDE